MKIEWNKVTKYSQVTAIVLFVAVFFWGIWLGMQIQNPAIGGDDTQNASISGSHPDITASSSIIAAVTYSCEGGKQIQAVYRPHEVTISPSGEQRLTLPQVISADGGRYANEDESFVFWSKGNGAFITEGSSTTYANCTQISDSVTQSATQ